MPKITSVKYMGGGNSIRWDPLTEATQYDQVKVYTATTAGASYGTALGTVNLQDYLYYDLTGSSTAWYKISNYDSINAAESAKSSAVQTSTIGTYATVKKVYEYMNWYNEQYSEAVGTGTGSLAIFDLANKKIVEGTLKVYVAGALKVVNDDYSFDSEFGRITFVTASIPTLAQAVTADYWWSDYSSRLVSDYLQRSQAHIDQMLGRTFYGVASVTQVYNGNSWNTVNWFSYEAQDFSNLASDFKPVDAEFIDERTLLLKNFPIVAVSAFSVGGTAVDAADYDILTEEGIIYLHVDSGLLFTKGVQNVSVTYTYGYTDVPKLIEELSVKLTAIEVLRSRLLGMPNASLDVPTRHINALKEDVKEIYEAVGRKLSVKVI